jgi:hypothetical protein
MNNRKFKYAGISSVALHAGQNNFPESSHLPRYGQPYFYSGVLKKFQAIKKEAAVCNLFFLKDHLFF